jgi:hypothetical protein
VNHDATGGPVQPTSAADEYELTEGGGKDYALGDVDARERAWNAPCVNGPYFGLFWRISVDDSIPSLESLEMLLERLK